METSKFIKSSLPLGKDIVQELGRFNSEISTPIQKKKKLTLGREHKKEGKKD